MPAALLVLSTLVAAPALALPPAAAGLVPEPATRWTERGLELGPTRLRLAAEEAPPAPAPGDELGPAGHPMRGELSDSRSRGDDRMLLRLVGEAVAGSFLAGAGGTVGFILVLGSGFSGASDAAYGATVALVSLGVNAAGAGGVYLVGNWLGGHGSYLWSFGAGVGGLAVAVGLVSLLNAGSGSDAGAASYLLVPVLPVVGWIVGYELGGDGKPGRGGPVGGGEKEGWSSLVPAIAPLPGGGGVAAVGLRF